MSDTGAAHEPFAELAAGYALRALEPQDEVTFGTHLSSCSRCQRELDEHLETLEVLAYAPPAPALPPELLGRIRAGMRETAQQPDGEPALATPDDSTSTVVPFAPPQQRRRAGRQRSLAAVAVAAAAVLVLGLGGWNLVLQRDTERARSELTFALEQLSVDGARTLPLREPDGTSVAVAVVNGRDVSLLVDGLPANEPGTTYVLWGRVGNTVRPLANFSVDRPTSTQSGQVEASVPGQVSQVLLTREQGDKAPPQPRSPVLARSRA